MSYKNIHNYFEESNISYCLYCDEFLNQPEYKIIKNKDKCNVKKSIYKRKYYILTTLK